MLLKVSRSRGPHSVALAPEQTSAPASHGLRPMCPCCAPQPAVKRPSQRLAERLAALRQRDNTAD